MRVLAAGLALMATLLPAFVAAAAGPTPAAWAPRADRYAVEWGSVALGEGTIALKPKGNGCYDYVSSTDPIALVRWTYGSPRERSEFCVRDGAVVAQHFEFNNNKNRDQSFSLDFDWNSRRAKLFRGGTIIELKVPDGTCDRFSIREAVRAWVIAEGGKAGAERDFYFVDDEKLRIYRFAIRGAESVKTAAGTFDTVRVERIDNPKKSFRYWMAPARAYVPVKIEHINKGKVELRMSLLPAK